MELFDVRGFRSLEKENGPNQDRFPKRRTVPCDSWWEGTWSRKDMEYPPRALKGNLFFRPKASFPFLFGGAQISTISLVPATQANARKVNWWGKNPHLLRNTSECTKGHGVPGGTPHHQGLSRGRLRGVREIAVFSAEEVKICRVGQ